jgi:sucrose phosphorylase
MFLRENNYEADNGVVQVIRKLTHNVNHARYRTRTKTDVTEAARDNSFKKYLRCILGTVEINDAFDDVIDIKWVNNNTVAHLKGTLKPIV